MFKANAQYWNQPRPLVDYLLPFVADKKEVIIADFGSGPFSKTGHYLEGVRVEVLPSDRNDFFHGWARHGLVPNFPIDIQNMEATTYPDECFDIVHCVNALDHTKDARAAIQEMIRVCKPGGWIYVDCALIQRSTSGGHHYWDAEEDGTFVSKKDKFNLKDYGFTINLITNHNERRYNHIIATRQK